MQCRPLDGGHQLLLDALSDPVYGSDVLSHRAIEAALHRLHDRESPSAVSTDRLERKLPRQFTMSESRTVELVMAGARNRIENLTHQTTRQRLFDDLFDEMKTAAEP